jgi:SAM-dependent methyltransferase
VRVFISYAHDNAAHEDKVRRLCDALRRQGIDARIDLPAAAQRQDWPLWMLEEFMAAHYVLVTASPEYKRRAEGRAPPGQGLGVQWEAFLIRNEVYSHPQTALRRYFPVVLPGCAVDDIPLWLGPQSTTHYSLTGYTKEATSELVHALTQQQRRSAPPLKPLRESKLERRGPSAATVNRLRRDVARRLVDRYHNRQQSMAHADIQQLLLIGGLGLAPSDLGEDRTTSPSEHSQIIVETARTVFEVRRDLRVPSILKAAEHQLKSSLDDYRHQTNERYAGIITDGAEWHAYIGIGHELSRISTIVVESNGANVDRLLTWLDSVLATGQDIKPDPKELIGRLGVDSPGHQLDAAELTALYKQYGTMPHVQVKRQMWARLLTTASGTHFTDENWLFVNHTLLVAMAKVIGHAVINLHPERPELSAGSIMSGSGFLRSQISGVIETDFFDWVVDVPGGEQFIKLLALRLARFNWNHVEHDVMKLLYESIIPSETRKHLGEHYTPDWLADEIVAECINEPLTQRVLDASCGSGTFLFHAVRRYLRAADNAGLPNAEAIRGVVQHVLGIDVHPVAVTLARVTYLLAIGMERLNSDSHPPFTVPVFLGDSLKWGQNQALWSYEGLSIPTDDDYEMFINDPDYTTGEDFDDRLKFPDRVVADTEHFDELVTDLANKAATRGIDDPIPSLAQFFEKFSIENEDRTVIRRTFENMCKLHDSGRDHIWGYYVRNLARPAWLSQPQNRLDVLVGNPPWLAYRDMTRRQQAAFHDMTAERGLWGGASLAPTQDLSALFAVRCVEQYLKLGGRFGFVMPGAVLTLGHYQQFRSGAYGGKTEPLRVRFERPWDLHMVKPKFFSQHVSVVLGRRASLQDGAMPLSAVPELWSGRLDSSNASKAEAVVSITRTIGEPSATFAVGSSPYGQRFHQGATFVPQFLFLVEPDAEGSLGAGIGRRAVRSRRSLKEHRPWIDIETLHETVEGRFVRPIYLGESMLPFRLLDPLESIVPWDGSRLLRGSEEDLYRYPGLAEWWDHSEDIWNNNRSNARISFRARVDYMRGLSKQLPASNLRVVYNKSGKYLASAIVMDPAAVIGQQLYWGSVASLEEGRFISAILNSTTVTKAIRPMQSRGENSPRDFGKLMFRLPIPLYDAQDAEHNSLVLLAERAERVVAGTGLPQRKFEHVRGYIREQLTQNGVIADIDTAVKNLLS